MGIHYTDSKPHWNYFIALERDFETLSRYVEPCEANNDTYSLELARLVMAATQEVDVVMKLLCESVRPNEQFNGIGSYHELISNHVPDFKQEWIRLPRFGMASQPWIDWNAGDSPLWWRANNKIKHKRSDHFDQATMKNAFNALGGLLITIAYYYNYLAGGGNPAYWPDLMDELRPAAGMFRLNPYYYREIVDH